MSKENICKNSFLLTISLFLGITFQIYAQDSFQNNQKSNFWDRTSFGGTLGLGFGNNVTDITIGPSALYSFNSFLAAGLGVQYNYYQQKDVVKTNTYGVNLIGIVTPIEQIQISVEVEQLRINNEVLWVSPTIKKDFWNTGLFLGAGYRMGKVTLGVRYNVLYKEKDYAYNQAWMPFVRAYF